MSSFDSFTLSPMSAGDIIDRAVRLYKRNFLAFVRIVLAPSLTAYLGRVLFYAGMNNFSFVRGDARVAMTTLMIVSGGLLWMIGETAFYAVLGGSSRALIAHFFEGKPILARDVYGLVRQKIWSILGALLSVGLIIVAVAWIVILFFAVLAMISGLIINLSPVSAPSWVRAVFAFLWVASMMIGILLVMLLVYSRLVYVPQVLMVEGKSVFGAISRSFQLARGELLRIAAVIFFWIYIAWSLWVLMAVPLGWYAYAAGVDIMPFNEQVPLWYQIAKQTLTQLSEILIWPIAMLCFTLLYINSRVRKEGYDIELLANRALDAPVIPQPADRPIDAPPQPQERWTNLPSIIEPNYGAPQYGSIVSPIREAARVENQVATPVIDFAAEVSSREIGGAPSGAIAESSAAPKAKICPWCESQGATEDRFCRVCGSVF